MHRGHRWSVCVQYAASSDMVSGPHPVLCPRAATVSALVKSLRVPCSLPGATVSAWSKGAAFNARSQGGLPCPVHMKAFNPESLTPSAPRPSLAFPPRSPIPSPTHPKLSLVSGRPALRLQHLHHRRHRLQRPLPVQPAHQLCQKEVAQGRHQGEEESEGEEGQGSGAGAGAGAGRGRGSG